MRAGYTARDLSEKRLLNLDELCRLDDVQDFLNFPEEHDLKWRKVMNAVIRPYYLYSYLFLRARLRPELEEPLDDLLRERGVLLKKLDHTIGQLGMVEGEATDFMQRNQNLAQELLVFRLERQREAVDNAAQDLQQLAHPVEVFGFIDEPRRSIDSRE